MNEQRQARDEMKGLTFTCPSSLKEASLRRAEQEGLSLSNFIRKAINGALVMPVGTLHPHDRLQSDSSNASMGNA